MPEPIVKSPTQARAASKEGVVRYVLAGSLLLIVVLCAIGYMVTRYFV
jgi:hypothetical protein